MPTPEQENWINHLSDESVIKIYPLDTTAETKYHEVKYIVQSNLGQGITVEHHGASSLGISGQDEIDIYIPVSETEFDSMIDPLTELFGGSKSFYPLKRARFVTEVDAKHIDVILINESHDDWKNLVKFELYLRSNPDVLEEYRRLKESGDGLSVREYYRRKTEFFNDVISKSDDM